MRCLRPGRSFNRTQSNGVVIVKRLPSHTHRASIRVTGDSCRNEPLHFPVLSDECLLHPPGSVQFSPACQPKHSVRAHGNPQNETERNGNETLEEMKDRWVNAAPAESRLCNHSERSKQAERPCGDTRNVVSKQLRPRHPDGFAPEGSRNSSYPVQEHFNSVHDSAQ